ncbi:TPA: HlyD family type I secretion periplasmic adaptor subunit [Pseudomonas aeruginosa]
MSGQARLREVGAGGAALELDEKRFSRLGWGLVLLGFVGFLLWAGLAPLDKGVGVSGTVMVAGSRKAVQHPTGGLVRHIRVHEGERVEAGQVLLEMDATQARAQADGLFAQYLAALASLARLSAERDEKARIEFPAELLALDDPRLPTLLEQQRQLHDSRRRALRLELDGLAETVAGSQAQLDGLQAALRSKEQQRAALEEQLRGLRQLASEGYVPRNRLLDSERLLAQVNGEIAGDLGSLGSTRRQILELRLRMAQRREKFQEEVRGSLADAQVRAEELRNRLASARFDLANSEVRAPVAGLVVGQEVFTEGGVIAPGQQLMEILPERQPLLVDARLPVEMVDKVRVGLPVELMFSAFNQSTTPRVEGEVTLVSADRLLAAPIERFPALRLQPATFEGWRQVALQRSAELGAQRYALEAAAYEVERNRAGHLPRLSLYASSSKTHSASESTYEQKYDTDSVGLRLSLPLFEGGRVSAATRQAGDKYAQAQAELDAQVASVINDLHSQFDLTASSLAKVRAYEMAVAAAREQVTATRRSVAGGERVNRDVLDAEQQFYGARRDLAEARYAYLNAWLRLRQLAGVLEDRDLAVLAAYFGAGEGRAQVAAAIR